MAFSAGTDTGQDGTTEKAPRQLLDAADPMDGRGGSKRFTKFNVALQDHARITARETRQERRERIRKANLAECCNMVLFFIFLFIFTASMILDHSSVTSRLAVHIRSKLDGGSAPLTSVSDVPSLYEYLEEVFIPALYENTTDTQMAMALSEYLHPIDVSNRLLGGVRLRQVRVSLTDDCQVSPLFRNYKISCYPPFEPGTESQASFGPGEKFVYSRDASGQSYAGMLGSYTPDGFMVVLPTNRTAALAKLHELEDDKFLDMATRAVFIDFTVWNANVATYTVVSITVEFGASGGIKQNLHVRTMREGSLVPGGLGSARDWAAFLGMIATMMFVTWFFIEEFREMCRLRVKYLYDGWNLADLVNLVFLVIGFVYQLLSYSTASSLDIGSRELQDKHHFTNFQDLAFFVEQSRLYSAFNSVILWIKVLKFFRHVPFLKGLLYTVWKTFDRFIPYLIMFGVMFVGFVMSYNIGFGDKILTLSTFGRSGIYLCRAFLKDVELMTAYQITPAFGALLILLFYVSLMLVGINVIFAILCDSMFRARYETERSVSEPQPLEEFGNAVHAVIKRFVKQRSPWLYRKAFLGRKRTASIVSVTSSTVAEGVWDGNQYSPSNGKAGRRTSSSPNGGNQMSLAIEDSGGGGAAAAAVAPNSSFLALPALGMKSTARSVAGGWRGGGGGGGRGGGSKLALSEKSSKASSSVGSYYAHPSRHDLMRAIEHMSGRVLSEISILGIEIKSELHEVCERVAQMQVAVEELTWRASLLAQQQQDELDGL